MISSFIWGGKSPRVHKSLLQRCKFRGGLALPNFLFYYWATHIHRIRCWVDSPHLAWCKLEAQSSHLISWIYIHMVISIALLTCHHYMDCLQTIFLGIYKSDILETI